MKVKALKTFISGRFSARVGEELEVDDLPRARTLIADGFAEAVDAADDKDSAPKAKAPKRAAQGATRAKK